MIVRGMVYYPHCGELLSKHFVDVLRKVDDVFTRRFQCPACETDLTATGEVVHHVTLTVDGQS